MRRSTLLPLALTLLCLPFATAAHAFWVCGDGECNTTGTHPETCDSCPEDCGPCGLAAVLALASPATSTAAAQLPFSPVPGAPQPAAIQCPPEPVTTCSSCLYFGIPSYYQCSTYCINGVFHRSCTTCGEGCNL